MRFDKGVGVQQQINVVVGTNPEMVVAFGTGVEVFLQLTFIDDRLAAWAFGPKSIRHFALMILRFIKVFAVTAPPRHGVDWLMRGLFVAASVVISGFRR